MLALSIRQPYAELILQRRKRIEYRPTNATEKVIGKRFYIYASQKKMPVALEQIAERAAQRIWSDDLAVPGPKSGEPPAWMLELAQELILGKLPTGVIVGTAVIESVTPPLAPPRSPLGGSAWYEWHLTDVERIRRFRKPTRQPQPTWFNPFK
jgi:hypothetical protein